MSSVATVEQVIRHRLSDLLGGWRGALEMALPTVAFVAAWYFTQDLVVAVVASLVAVVPLLILRIVQRSTLKHVLSSVFPTAIAAAVALRTGNAEDVFLPGLLWNAGMLALALVSVVVRWPMMGFMIAAADPTATEDPAAFTKWRRDRGMVTVCMHLTLVLAVLFSVRLVIMVPLFLMKNIEALGLAKLLLGWPAYLCAIMAMVALLVRGHTPTTLDDPHDTTATAAAEE